MRLFAIKDVCIAGLEGYSRFVVVPDYSSFWNYFDIESFKIIFHSKKQSAPIGN
jgi:hypothetical protein